MSDKDEVKIGDIQTDADGSQWVVIETFTRKQPSRVRRFSLAHQVHAESNAVIAESLRVV